MKISELFPHGTDRAELTLHLRMLCGYLNNLLTSATTSLAIAEGRHDTASEDETDCLKRELAYIIRNGNAPTEVAEAMAMTILQQVIKSKKR